VPIAILITLPFAFFVAFWALWIGGLTTSTLFTLVALPVWYTTVEDVGTVLARMLPRLERKGRAR
jgi:hypothetical protein